MKNLNILAHQNYDEWQKEYAKRFTSNDAIHVDINIAENPMFLCCNIKRIFDLQYYL